MAGSWTLGQEVWVEGFPATSSPTAYEAQASRLPAGWQVSHWCWSLVMRRSPLCRLERPWHNQNNIYFSDYPWRCWQYAAELCSVANQWKTLAKKQTFPCFPSWVVSSDSNYEWYECAVCAWVLTWGMLTITLLLATLATRMSPCWMILWPWTWTLGTEALGASRSGGGPEPLCCCCCWRRLAICWGVKITGW